MHLRSIFHGAGYWLPNSVALKGIQVDHASGWAPLIDVLTVLQGNYADRGIQLFILVAGVAVAALALFRVARQQALPLIVVLAVGTLHLCMARIGVLCRYEDYLVGAAIVVVAQAWPALWHASSRAMVAGACVLTVSFYAVNPNTEAPLREALERYRPNLPDGVVVTEN